MAVKGLDIFKLSPKKNCKECGSPTCMAFCMKVAQGAIEITKCPYMSEEAIALLSEATAPPMKTITVGEHKLGGETVMMRHEKTLVNRNLFRGDAVHLHGRRESRSAHRGHQEGRLRAHRRARDGRVRLRPRRGRQREVCRALQEGSGHRPTAPSSSTPRTSTPPRQLSRPSRTTSPSSTAPTRITSQP